MGITHVGGMTTFILFHILCQIPVFASNQSNFIASKEAFRPGLGKSNPCFVLYGGGKLLLTGKPCLEMCCRLPRGSLLAIFSSVRKWIVGIGFWFEPAPRLRNEKMTEWGEWKIGEGISGSRMQPQNCGFGLCIKWSCHEVLEVSEHDWF